MLFGRLYLICGICWLPLAGLWAVHRGVERHPQPCMGIKGCNQQQQQPAAAAAVEAAAAGAAPAAPVPYNAMPLLWTKVGATSSSSGFLVKLVIHMSLGHPEIKIASFMKYTTLA